MPIGGTAMPDNFPTVPLPPSTVILPATITQPPDIASLQAQMITAINSLEPGKRGAFVAGVTLNGDLHTALVMKVNDIWAVKGELAKSKNQGWGGGVEVMASF